MTLELNREETKKYTYQKTTVYQSELKGRGRLFHSNSLI